MYKYFSRRIKNSLQAFHDPLLASKDSSSFLTKDTSFMPLKIKECKKIFY